MPKYLVVIPYFLTGDDGPTEAFLEYDVECDTPALKAEVERKKNLVESSLRSVQLQLAQLGTQNRNWSVASPQVLSF